MVEVYIIDDERWLVKSMIGMIDWANHDAKIIGSEVNSVVALEEISRLKPDVVFTDVRMPNIDGLELIEKLREKGFEGVFVILSGHAEFDYVQKAMAHKVVDYCLKPIEKEGLEEALEKAKKALKDRRLLDALHRKNEVSLSDNNSFIEIKTYVDEHFAEELSVQQLAERFFLNAAYLSNLFKKESGVTFSSYLSKLRLEFACGLLKETKMAVADIAETSGFTNYFYFARQFKKHFKQTPTEYRDKQ